MIKKIGVVTGFQWVIGLSALSVAGSSLGIVSGLVFLVVIAAGNTVSFIVAQKGSVD